MVRRVERQSAGLVTTQAVRRDAHSLHRQGLGLIASTGLNAALGIAFWLLAGRNAPADVVAVALAAQSWLILLAMAAQLNLGIALSRFVPPAGAAQGSLVMWSYRVSILATAAVGVGVLALHAAGVELIAGETTSLVVAIAVSLPLWAAFSLQDSVLIACRRSTWLPWENGLAALLRLVLVVPLAAVAGATGLFLAFVLPAIPLVALLSWLIATRLVGRGEPMNPSGGVLVRYSLAGFPGSLSTMASLRLVPVVVLALSSAENAAYVGVPWSVLSLALLMLPSLSRALLTEMSTPGVDIDHVMHKVRRMLLLGLLPMCVVGALLAVPLLQLAGSGYADKGGPVLAAGLLALVPAGATEARLALLRFHGRPGSATVIQGVRAAVLLITLVALSVTDQLELLGVALIVACVAAWWTATRYTIPDGVPG